MSPLSHEAAVASLVANLPVVKTGAGAAQTPDSKSGTQSGQQPPVELLDRDHSILAFNERVFDWAVRTDVPLLERLRYLCIVSSNLDEFFEVRAAPQSQSLHQPPYQASRFLRPPCGNRREGYGDWNCKFSLAARLAAVLAAHPPC